jgi:hypothetical protein
MNKKKEEKSTGEEFNDFLDFVVNKDTRATSADTKKKNTKKKTSSKKKKDK